MNILAVDVGGTNVKAGVVRDGQVRQTTTLEAKGAAGAGQMLDRLAPCLRELMSPLNTSDFGGVAMALPVLIDSRKTRILSDMVGKFEGLASIDLQAWSQREFNLPIRIENDAHAALLGEWRFGAGRGANDLVMITLGTGIGTSVILGGRPLRGTHSQTGNLGGHLVMQPDGPPCSCGGRGCAESLHYIDTVNQLAREDPRFARSALSSLQAISYSDLFQLALTDPLAKDLLNRSLDIWGSLAVSLAHAFDPARIIVGGGIMRSAAAILPRLNELIKRAFTPWGRAEVVAAALGDAAALLGAASLFEAPPDFI